MNAPDLNLVIPCHNEEKHLQPLLSAIHATLDPLSLDYEVVVRDDCSTDNSWSVLTQLTVSDLRLCIQRFKFNCGESAASLAGM
jgi:dolichol-phosphate mannosyltransferase